MLGTVCPQARSHDLRIVLNVPTSDIRRNLQRYRHANNEVLDRALGTRRWRSILTSTRDVAPMLAELLVRQLERLG